MSSVVPLPRFSVLISQQLEVLAIRCGLLNSGPSSSQHVVSRKAGRKQLISWMSGYKLYPLITSFNVLLMRYHAFHGQETSVAIETQLTLVISRSTSHKNGLPMSTCCLCWSFWRKTCREHFKSKSSLKIRTS